MVKTIATPAFEDMTPAQLDDFMEQAQRAKAGALDRAHKAALEDVKKTLEDHGMTLEQFLAHMKPTKTPAKGKAPNPAKYRNADGLEWKGGRGRKPQWIQDALANGENIEDYKI